MALPYKILNMTEDIIASKDSTIAAKNNEFHLHNHFEIYLFLRGDVNYFVEQSVYHLQKGNLLIFNNHEIHRATFLSHELYERMVIHFYPQVVDSFSSQQTNLLQCFVNREDGSNNIMLLTSKQLEAYYYLANKLIECIHSEGYGNDVLAKSYLVQILIMINKIYQNQQSSISDSLSGKLKDILSFIDSNICKELSLDLLQKNFSINKYYLSRMFKKETGSSIYNYILFKKISIAKQLLLEGKNVTEACMMSGFNDYANFIRTFKHITGYSPARYHKYHQQKL